MDFKANLDDLATICKKIDNYNSSLLQEISNCSKIVDEIPYAWSDNGTKVFMEKYDATLKKLQNLSKAYTSITTETKNCINKYEMLDVEFANKIRRKDIGDVQIIDHQSGSYIVDYGDDSFKMNTYKDLQAESKYVNINKSKENIDYIVTDENGYEHIIYKGVVK